MFNEKKYNISTKGDITSAKDLSDKYEKKIVILLISLIKNNFPKKFIIRNFNI
jgi:hypothetical protein